MTKKLTNTLFNLRVGVTIFPQQDKAIDIVLQELYDRCPAQFILLTDISGQIVSVVGEHKHVEIVGLSSLIAGDLAASQEIARQTGQYQTYQLILREGSKTNTFISEAGKYLVLFAQVSTEVPLGWARLAIRKASVMLGEILNTPPDEVEEMDLEIDEESLGDLMGEALDSLWSE